MRGAYDSFGDRPDPFCLTACFNRQVGAVCLIAVPLHLALESEFPTTSDYLRASVSWALEIRAKTAEADDAV